MRKLLERINASYFELSKVAGLSGKDRKSGVQREGGDCHVWKAGVSSYCYGLI